MQPLTSRSSCFCFFLPAAITALGHGRPVHQRRAPGERPAAASVRQVILIVTVGGGNDGTATATTMAAAEQEEPSRTSNIEPEADRCPWHRVHQ